MTAGSAINRSTNSTLPEIRQFLCLIRQLFSPIGWRSTVRETYLPLTPPTAQFLRYRPTEGQSPILRQASIRATWLLTLPETFSQLTALPVQFSNILRPARERPLLVPD